MIMDLTFAERQTLAFKEITDILNRYKLTINPALTWADTNMEETQENTPVETTEVVETPVTPEAVEATPEAPIAE